MNHSEARLLFAGDVVWENLDESAMPDLDGVLRIEDYSLRTSNSKQLTEARARLNELFGKKFPVVSVPKMFITNTIRPTSWP